MDKRLNEEGMDLLFRQARTHNSWLPKPVSDDTLRELYELMKWCPTSANCSPGLCSEGVLPISRASGKTARS
jgi:3-hydroxypropanoate dehydrogenase